MLDGMDNSPYASVDPAIKAWARDHRLRIGDKHHWDCEVRTTDIARPRKWWFWWRAPCQIWVNPPDIEGFVEVHAWDRVKRKFVRRVVVDDTRAALEEALVWVQSLS